jgi:hypothetical protein
MLRKERRLSVLENKVLREVFGPMKGHVREGRRKLGVEERYAFLYSTSISISIHGPINTTL